MWRHAAVACAAGAAALALETIWMRWFRLLLGATAPAAAATLVAFFTGQTLGALWAVRRLRAGSQPLRAASVAAAGAALGALAVPLLRPVAATLIGGVTEIWRESPAALAAARFGLAVGLCLPASLGLGALLPFLGEGFVGDLRRLGHRGSALYAIYTFGGVLGVLGTTFWSIERLGVRASYLLGVAILAGIALVTFLGTPGRGMPRRPADATPPVHTATALGDLGLAAFSGFSFLALEVLLIQALAQVVNQSTLAFGSVLVCVIASLALGGALVSAADRLTGLDPRTALGLALSGCALAVAAFPSGLWHWTDGLSFLGSEQAQAYPLRVVTGTFVTAGPALLASALVLPLVFARASRRQDGSKTDARFGALLAANTAGGILGALVAPFLLLEWLDLWATFAALAVGYALVALSVPDASPRRRLRRDLLLAVGWIVILSRASPLAVPEARVEPGEMLIDSRSSAAGVVSVIRRGGELALRVDNHYVVGGTADRVHEERQAHVPLVLHPTARHVAYVGGATGISAGAALLHPVERLVVVEIVPGLVEAARLHFAAANRSVYDDPRVDVALDDARNFFATTQERFDVVIADLFVPWRSGAGSLYAREHFEAVRSHLREGGLFCQWLALYQLSPAEFDIVLATFLDVFPRAALFRGDFYGRFPIVSLIGWTQGPVDADAVSRAAQALGARGVEDRWVIDPVGFWALYAGSLAGARDALAGTPRNHDDRPRIEFLAARGHRGGRQGKRDPLVGPRWIARLHQLSAPAGEPLFRLDTDQRRAVAGGAALQRAGAAYVAGRGEWAARELAEAANLLPAGLLAEAPPDPTAAELWHDPPPRRDAPGFSR